MNGFHANIQYMSPGAYCFDDHIEYVARTDEYTQAKARKLFRIKDHAHALIRLAVKCLRRMIYSRMFSVEIENSPLQDFSGTIYIPTRSANGYSGVKIFDFQNNKVLSILTDAAEYLHVLETYEQFKDNIPMPAILFTNEEQLLIVEELIVFKPNDNWVEEDYLYVMADIFTRYIDYFKSCDMNGISTFLSPSHIVSALPDEQLTLYIKTKINPELMNLPLPLVKLHGDLWTSNTLIEAETYQIHYIDWEYSKELFFFYDFFTIMWIEFYENDYEVYIENYVKGEYDHQLMAVFILFNITFQPALRLDYFHIFFLSYIKERIKNYDKKGKMTIYHNYKRLAERMECLVNENHASGCS